jgi:hypothetical protein
MDTNNNNANSNTARAKAWAKRNGFLLGLGILILIAWLYSTFSYEPAKETKTVSKTEKTVTDKPIAESPNVIKLPEENAPMERPYYKHTFSIVEPGDEPIVHHEYRKTEADYTLEGVGFSEKAVITHTVTYYP